MVHTHKPKTQHNAVSVPRWVPRNSFSKEGFSYAGSELVPEPNTSLSPLKHNVQKE